MDKSDGNHKKYKEIPVLSNEVVYVAAIFVVFLQFFPGITLMMSDD